MKSIAFILTLIFACNQSTTQTGGKTYTIKKDMIYSFDKENFEIKLTEEAQKAFTLVDFSKYNYIEIKHFNKKILIIGDKMAFRPPEVFIYRNKKSISSSEGIIKLQVDGSGTKNKEVAGLEKIFD